MKATPVMLDSSILRQIKKLKSPLLNQLIKYVRIGKYQLYISEIIEKEYLSAIKNEAQEAFDKIVKATKVVYKYYDKPLIMGFPLDFNITVHTAQNHFNDILKNIAENWNEFKNKTNTVILPISEKHGSLVMNAYFEGSEPFSKIKNRDDVPDAFIYYSILEILKEHEKVLFICNDSKFKKNIHNKNIIVFESLNELFASADYGLGDDFFSLLSKKDRAYKMIQFFQDEILSKAEREIEISDLVYDIEHEEKDDLIGSYKETITKASSIMLDYSNIKSITEYSFLVSYNAELNHSLSSIATINELENINIDRKKSIKEKELNDDGTYTITEEYITKVSGSISITFDHSDPLTWKEQESNNLFKEKEIREIEVVLEEIGNCT